MNGSKNVSELRGVGEATLAKLNKLGITTLEDLLLHYPRKYDDFSHITTADKAEPGPLTLRGRVVDVTTRRSKRGTTVTEAVIEDDTGEIKAVWFNQPYLGGQLSNMEEVFVSGELAFRYQQYGLQNPVIERASSFQKDTARIVPVYPETAGLSSKQLRSYILQALKAAKIHDPIPQEVRDMYKLMPKKEAIGEIHFPTSLSQLTKARTRLAFEELYLLLLVVRMIRGELTKARALAVEFDEELSAEFTKRLPFDLTDDQRKVAWQIIQDIQKTEPMNRLMQGDVGSGKTAVAALIALLCVRAGLQVAVLAPTEILARQHVESLRQFLDGFDIDVELLVGGLTKSAKTRVTAMISDEKPLIVVGTHALLGSGVAFARLGLLIIDEQHRFGVSQRRHLQESSRYIPHTLSMSATPIPRSLAQTVYGYLDISSIRQMPPGRKPVKTYVRENARELYQEIEGHIKDGHQVFVVCPLIEDSESSELASVASQIKKLRAHWKRAKIAGMHGRLKSEEKHAIMQDFADRKIDVLVSTTVIEVGVDVAGTNVILIEGAERFGLATLHQLRGRVGRSGAQAYCYLKPSQRGLARERLGILERHHDGFVLAEKDMELRGAGELYGQRQHGIVDLRIAKITDSELIEKARKAADVTKEISAHPELKKAIHKVYSRIDTN